MDTNGILTLVFCILAVPAALGFWIGWIARGRQPAKPTNKPAPSERDHVAWLLDELAAPRFQSIVDEDDQRTIAAFYGATLPMRETPPRLVADEPAPAAPAPAPEPALPDAIERVQAEAAEAGRPDVQSPRTVPAASARSRPEWDPAVLMLYLGAFLVVAAGLVYASYNWGELGAGQKLGFLAAATVAFAGTGVALLGNQRLRPAAETFVVIGALLVPANAVAVYAVVEQSEVRSAVIVLLGSLVTALVYGAFSLRPGGVIYRYGAVIASALAIGALLPAFGTSVGWGAVTVILGIAAAPAIGDRLQARWIHLRQPLRRVGIAALPVATVVGLGSAIETSNWVIPATLAATTLALIQLAMRTTNRLPAALASVSGIGTVIGLLIALDIDSATNWALAAIVISFALVLIGHRGPAWIRSGWLSALLHTEAVLGFIAAAVYADDGSDWQVSAALTIGIAGTASIALLRNARWWLVIPAGFATATWLSTAAFFDAEEWSMQAGLHFGIPLPLLLGATAFGLDRWSRRVPGRSGAWGEPVWLVAGILAAVVTALPLLWWADSEARLLTTLAWSSALFGIAALVAARSIGKPLVRLASGVWWVIAIGAIAWDLPLIIEDRLPIVAVLAAIVAGLSPRFLRSAHNRDIPAETPVLGGAIIASLSAMLLVSAAFIVDASDPGEPGLRWTWTVYVAVYIAISVGSAVVGHRLGEREQPERNPLAVATSWLPETSLLFGLAASALSLRLVTSDPLAWTWAGMAIAAVLVAIGHVVDQAKTVNPFTKRAGLVSHYAGIGLGFAAVLANLAIGFDPSRDGRDWVQAAIYAAIGGGGLWLARARERTTLSFVGFGAFTVAVIFGLRAVDGDGIATVTSLMVLAWFVAGSSLALPRSGRWAIHRPAWEDSALGIGVLAVILAIYENDGGDLDSRAWQTLVVSLVSLAGLLVVSAMMRGDRIRGLVASVIAMLALLLQIAVDEPSNIQAYSIPLALYLLALGFVQRRRPVSRDVLLGMGSAALLVPALLQAAVDERFASLLLAGGEALALFLGGLALRLRVPIASGMAAITLIALRMMVDTVAALPSWISLLIVGLVLLGGGTLLLVWKDAFQARLERLRGTWREMG